MPRGRPKKSSSRRKRASSAPPVMESPKKRLRWSNESMVAAMNAVSKGCSVNRAAAEHGIPRTTLQDRISGKVQHGTRPGPTPYLNKSEEGNLVEFLEVVSSVGYGKTRKQVMNIVESTARDKGILKKQKISDGWFRRFIERQPKLALRKGDRTAFVRMDAMKKQEELDNYYICLKSILVDNNLMDKPGQIYNVDESGMPLEHRSPRVLAKKGQRKVRYCTSGNKSQVTVVACINAIGQCLPPFIIFDAKNLNMDWAKEEVPGTTYGLSDSGWIDMLLFKKWFFHHFLNHAGPNRPLLLLLDGHSSHYNLEAVEIARKNDVIIFTLVPHTTHEMQPLDTTVFGPLKNSWQEACHNFIQRHPGRVITKYQFNEIFSMAWLKSMTPANIISGFKACGVYPFNPKAVLDHDPCEPKLLDPSAPQTSDSAPQTSDAAQCYSSQANSLTQCGSSTSASSSHGATDTFTPEEEARFLIRYNEGYDLPDPRYLSWLQLNHPEDNCRDLMEHFVDLTPLDSIDIAFDSCLFHCRDPASPSTESICSLSANPETSVTDVTPGLTPSRYSRDSDITSPRSILPSISTHPISSIAAIIPGSTTSVVSCVISPSTSSVPVHPISTEKNTTLSSTSSHFSHNSDAISLIPVSNNSPSPLHVSSSTSSVSCTVTSSSVSSASVTDAISKYLVQYVSPPPAKKSTTSTRVIGTRVLTSAEGLAILREKEDKKKKEIEEKERRKRERLEKKKEKEELAKKKAEEKSKKASLPRQSKRSSKRPAASRSSNQVESTSSLLSGPSHNSTTTTSEVGTSLSVVTMHDTVMHTTELNSTSSTATVAPAGLNDQDCECCECFGTFEEDIILGNEAEWAQCGCGRWLHADCINETAMDENGKPRMCSNCVI